VFSRDGGLYSYRLSTGAVSTIAPPCAFVTTCVTPPIWSPDASKLYAIREAAIWEYAVGGGQGRKLYSAAQLSELTLSPDGQYLAFIEYESVRVLSTGTGSLTPATVFYGSAFNNAEEYLAWSPDSKSLVMLILQNPRYYLYGVNRDGTGMKELARVAGVSGLSWGR
jgi:Tol biopolymer transport system component